MKKLLLTSAFLLVGVLSVYAQYNSKQNNIWAWGSGSGLDFNSGSPVAINTNNASDSRASAVVSDENGSLLFYTNGDSIWNKNGVAMPNGYELHADGRLTGLNMYGTVIMPVLDNSNQYYVFSMEDIYLLINNTDINSQRLYYSVVDMTLDNGLGDVVPGKKQILLDSLLGSQMFTVKGTNCNMWLMVHEMNTNKFKAYEITAAGINTTPVISNVGYLTCPLIDSATTPVNLLYSFGAMKVSPDNKKIVLTSYNAYWYNGEYSSGAEIFNFDAVTGMVSNPILLDSANMCYSACFSSDNSKLYVEFDESGTMKIEQFNLSLATTAAIINSKTILTAPSIVGSDMKLAPDGKIYMNSASAGKVNRIDAPNLAGNACQLTADAMSILYVNPNEGIGLPNEYVSPERDTITSATNVPAAVDSVKLYAPAGARTRKWSTGSTDSSITVKTTGSYWVKTGAYCTHIDTFVVKITTSITGVSNNIAAVEIKAFPVPAQNVVNVTVNGIHNATGTLHIVDALGRVVVEVPYAAKQVQVDVSSLANGTYTIVYTDDANTTYKQHTRLVIAK